MNKLYLYKRYKTIPFNCKDFNSRLNNNFIDFNIDRLLSKTKDKVKITNIITILATTLFISANPTSSFAISSLETFKNNGLKLVDEVSSIIIQGIVILTALRLTYEYFQGADDYRIFNVLKESIGAILLLLLLPRVPTIFTLLIK